MARLNDVKAPYWDNIGDEKCLIVRAAEYLHYYCVNFDEFKYQEIGGKPSLNDATMHIARMNELFPSPEYEKMISDGISETMM